jgi:hypothetical protein
MAAPIEPGPQLQVGVPRELFRVPGAGGHEVSPDGQKFLLNVGTEDITNAPMTVLVDWTAALRSATR